MRFHPILKRFRNDERGAISIMILPMFLLIVLLGALAIDIYSEETFREDLQDSVDRGTLAATSLTQTLEPQDVVQSYVNARTYADTAVTADVTVEDNPGARLVRSNISYDMPTIFWSFAGLKTMPVTAATAAFEGQNNIEISLVLDISGSMASETSFNTAQKRLAIMRAAATQFVTDILDRPGAQNISISLIPFAGQTNAGPLFSYMVSEGSAMPGYANSCIEFTDGDFQSAALPALNSRPQSPQFQNFRFEGFYGYEADWGWCPQDDRGIVPFTNDLELLTSRIAGIRAHDGTGTQIGMKWALSLLDPSTQPITEDMAAEGDISPLFANRPAAYTDGSTTKYLILMTDGNIRYQNQPKSSALSSQGWLDFWGGGPRYSNGQIFNLLWYYKRDYGVLADSSAELNDEALRAEQFLDLCGVARDKGIHVYTIGFDIASNSNAYQEMRDCATVPGNFFDVDGLDLFAAFSQINAFVQKLQLIQ